MYNPLYILFDISSLIMYNGLNKATEVRLMTLGDIIKSYRETNSLSMDDFARSSGISKTYISMLEKNFNPKTGQEIAPTIETIGKAAKGMFMSFDELFAMIGEDTKVKLNATGSDKIAKKSIQIPVLGKVAAGIPFSAVEDVIDYEEISEEMAHSGEIFALKIKGDSMEPEIRNGDVVIVRSQDSAESGDIVIALVNGNDATCKRLVRYATGIRLMPINPSYEPMYYSNEEIESKPVKIIGKVIENRRKY